MKASAMLPRSGAASSTDGAELLEAARRLGADLPRLAVDRHLAAEIGREGDALGRHRARDGARRTTARRVEGQRIARAQARHGIEEQRDVGHVARHRPLHRERREQVVRRAARDAARRGPQAHDGAVGGGAAQAAGMVGAVRQPDFAGRQRRGAAAGRAAAGQRGVPGVARAPEHLVEGRAAGAELRRVRLGDDDAALALDALDDRMRASSAHDP